jgi:hypothetical protein
LFLEPKDLSKSLGFCLAKLSPLLFETILFRYLGHTVDLANIIGLALTNVLNITRVFLIARSDIGFFVFLATRTKRYTFSTSTFNSFTKDKVTSIGKTFR